jgi:5'-3' exonuclease
MSKHFVLVDLSYVIFHRYFAVMAWSRLTQNNIEDKTEVCEKMKKGLHAFLQKLKKILKLENLDNVFLMRDTSRSMIWRNAVYPGYKKNRDVEKAGEAKFDPEVFAMMHEQIAEFGMKGLGVPRAEADDVIAVSTRVLYEKYPDAQVTIITNDNDFVQLVTKFPSLHIYNANFVDIVARFDETMLSVYTEWKVIKGDKSDNIPSIGPKIGDKTALKLALAPELLAKKLTSDPAVNERYLMNKTLIDFNSIPAELQGEIEHGFRKLINNY